MVALATGRWDWQPLAASFGALVAAAAAQAGALGLSRGLGRLRSLEEEQERLLERLDTALDEHAAIRIAELERTLVRERAETVHLLGEQERAIRDDHRAEIDRHADEALNRLTEEITSNQERLENRLSAWSSDLERAQQQLKTRLEELIRKQAEALQGHEARLEDHAAEVASLEQAQQAELGRIRAEVERASQEVLTTMQGELEVHAAERRRALHEVSERLRSRERSMREQIEREGLEFRGQLDSTLSDVERRHLEQLERSLDRAVLRLSEDAERRFDQQLKDSREKTAERLSREIEHNMERFTKTAEQQVAGRIAEAAQLSASKFQRQVDDVVRAAEMQTQIANERIQTLTERLDQSLEAASAQLAAFEANVELELSEKLAEIEHALRTAAEQSIERDRADSSRSL